jgi:hypothetical protein
MAEVYVWDMGIKKHKKQRNIIYMAIRWLFITFIVGAISIILLSTVYVPFAVRVLDLIIAGSK